MLARDTADGQRAAMDTPLLTPEMEAIVRVIARYPDGATFDDINAGLSTALPKTKVLFFTQQLEARQRIRTEKFGGTVHYFLVEPPPTAETNDAAGAATSAPAQSPSAEPSGAAPDASSTDSKPAVTQPAPALSVTSASAVQTPMAQAAKNPAKPPLSIDAPVGAPLDGTAAATASTNGPGNAAPANGGASERGAADALFAEHFGRCVFKIVTTPGGGKLVAISVLQKRASEHFADEADRRAFIAYGRTRLEKLTKEESNQYEIEPEQFDFWRRNYFAGASEQPVASSEREVEKDTEPRAANSEHPAGKKRSSSSSANAPATPKGFAKLLAKHVDPYVPEEFRPYVRGALVIVGAALLTPLIGLMNLHPWQALGLIVAVVVLAIAGVWVWKRFGGAATEAAVAADQEPGGADAPSGGTEVRSVGAADADRPLDRSTVTPTAAGSAQPRSRRPLYKIAAATVVLAGAGIAIFYGLRTPRPSAADVSAWLEKSVAPLPVRVAALDLTYISNGSTGCVLQYTARLETTEPLFKAQDAAAYLRAHFPTEIGVIEKDKGRGTRDQGLSASQLAAIGPAPTPAISELLLVQVQTPPGASALTNGTLTAWQRTGAWTFTGSAPFVDRRTFAGDPKPANAFVVDFPEDEARLKSLIAEHAAYAAKVQAAATALAADLAREQTQKAAELERQRQQQVAELAFGRTVEPSNGRTAGSVEATTAAQKAADVEQARQQKLTALNQLLQRGTLLSGMVVAVPKPDSYPVLLEVTDCSATTHQITLVLRNTSGWYNTRSGKGTWSIDADNEVCTAKVWFANDERIPGAGRPLDDTGSWYLTVRVRLDGTIAAEPRGWELQRVAADAVAAAKAEFGFGAGRTVEPSNGRTAGGAVAATTSGTAAARSNGATASDQPIDRSTVAPSGGSAAVTPLDRSTVTPTASADAALASALNDLSLIAGTRTGAYALIGGTWLPLPTNSAKAVQGVAQKLTGTLANLTSWQDKLAGKSSTPASTAEAGEIRFDGIESVPTAPAKELVIAYVGPLTPVSADAKARYPELKDYPVMELALEKTAAKGVRYATLYRLPGGYLGFANTRVMSATVEQGTANLTILRATAPLPRGQYALACGDNSYEVRVE